jgi:hypothetical protein
LESLLDETRKELSSSQLIIKLLHKEIIDITTEKMPKPTNTIPGYEAGGNVASSYTWSRVASKQPHNKNKARIPNTYQVTQPTETTNRYTKLTDLPDTTNCYDGYVMPKMTRVTQISTNNYKKKKEHRRIRHPSIIGHPRNTTKQPSTCHHEMISEQMSHQNSNYIPTIVNGQINPTKNDKNNNSANNNRDYILNLVRESTVKVLDNKAKYSKYAKHTILVTVLDY